MVRYRSAGGRLYSDRLLLRPNPPLSRRGRWGLVGALAAVLAGYSIYWASRGFWPVLPFAGLELVAVAAALHVTARRGRCYESVQVDARELRILRRDTTGRRSETLRSGWARVRLAPGLQPRYPARLLVGVHGRWIELGRFLNESERRQAAGYLHRALEPHTVRRRTV